jgi:hypothetical protein
LNMPRRWRAAFWVAAAMVGVAAIACRQLVGIQDSPPGAIGEVCGLTFASNACGSCASASCCAESSACAANPLCAPYETCVAACEGNAGCQTTCLLDHPLGTSVSEAASLSACLAAKCGAACGGACGTAGSLLSPPDGAAACQDCYAENACDAGAACNASANCVAEALCFASCPTPDCREACATSIPDDAGLVSSLGSVRLGPCQTQCAHGSDWACLGHVMWPSTQAPSSEFTLQVVDFTDPDAKGLPSIEVRYCSGDDLSVDAEGLCENPLAGPTQTDENGIATIRVSTGEPTFLLGYVPNYLELSSTPTSPTIVTELLFLGFPLSQAKYWLVSPSREPANNGAFISGPISVLTPDDLALVSASEHVNQSMEKGLLAAAVYDCLGAYAVDAHITLDGDNAGTHAFSVGVGLYGILNVFPGRATVTATATNVGRPSSQERVLIRANAVTVVFMVPTQAQ